MTEYPIDREAKKETCALLMAAGQGRRMQATCPKQFLKIGRRTILERAYEALYASDRIGRLLVVCPAGYEDKTEALLGSFAGKDRHILTGGAERQDSVERAVRYLEETGFPDGGLVLIHDGARPFVSQDAIRRCLDAARATGAACCCIRPTDTVRTDDGKTLDRDRLYLVQTPQAFRFDLLRKAHREAIRDGFRGTDDATLVQRSGHPVLPVPGDRRNRKITVPGDEEEVPAGTWPDQGGPSGVRGGSIRIGQGIDVHPFAQGRKLILGGVEIPSPRGLAGHSDADVLTHALLDAIAGAAGLGDIGRLFPDTDPAYRGISSVKLLRRVSEYMRAKGFLFVNGDCTLIGEEPKIAPYADQMRERLATALSVEPGQISIKGTTTEKLGFSGRREGLAAEAVCLLQEMTGKDDHETEQNIF